MHLRSSSHGVSLIYRISNLQDKLSKENETVFRLDGFDTDLLKYEKLSSTIEFHNSRSSHMLLPHIIQPN